MYDMSNNMVRYGTVEEAIVNNCEHRWYVEHYGHGIYLWMTQTKTTMFTNEMSYNEDTIELWKTQTYRRKVKHIEGRICQTIRTR